MKLKITIGIALLLSACVSRGPASVSFIENQIAHYERVEDNLLSSTLKYFSELDYYHEDVKFALGIINDNSEWVILQSFAVNTQNYLIASISRDSLSLESWKIYSSNFEERGVVNKEKCSKLDSLFETLPEADLESTSLVTTDPVLVYITIKTGHSGLLRLAIVNPTLLGSTGTRSAPGITIRADLDENYKKIASIVEVLFEVIERSQDECPASTKNSIS